MRNLHLDRVIDCTYNSAGYMNRKYYKNFQSVFCGTRSKSILVIFVKCCPLVFHRALHKNLTIFIILLKTTLRIFKCIPFFCMSIADILSLDIWFSLPGSSFNTKIEYLWLMGSQFVRWRVSHFMVNIV